MAAKSWRRKADFEGLPRWAQVEIQSLRRQSADYRTENVRLRELLDYERNNR